MGVLRGQSSLEKVWKVSNCDKSTGLEYSSNDKSIKIDIKWKLALKGYHIWDWVSKLNSRLSFLPTFTSGKKCLEFPLPKLIHGLDLNLNVYLLILFRGV